MLQLNKEIPIIRGCDCMRHKHIDVVKGIGIILVVLGHTYSIPEYLYNLIYSFHMPLFFILSGLVYNEKKNTELPFFEFLKKKAKSYLVPYYLYALINLVIELLWSKFYLRENVTLSIVSKYVKGIFLCSADITNMPNCSPIWFFMCLFIASLVIWFIVKYASKIKWLFCVLFMVTGYLLSICLPFMLPFKLDTVFMAVSFMIIGLYAENCDKILKMCFMILAIPGIYFAVKNGENVGMNENAYGNLLMFIFAAVSLSLSLIYICEKADFDKTGFLAWIGKNTLPIIGFNYFLRDFTTEIYYFIPIIKQYKMHWTVSFMMTIVACICLIVIRNFIKTKIHNSDLRLKS